MDDSVVYDEIPGGDEEAAIIETRSTDSLDTNVTTTNRSILSRVNERIIETQINLHESVGDWGIRTENILALFWGGIVFFIGLSFNIAQANTVLDTDKFATTYWVLFCFMSIGIIFMAVTLHHRDNENIFVYNPEDEEPSDNNKMLRFLFCNVFIFALGLYVMDIFSCINVFHCGFGVGDISLAQGNQYASILIYHVTRFTFVSLQLILLQVLIGAKIRRSGYYQFCIKVLCVHVIVTNISMWMTKFCQETGIFGHNIPTGEYDGLNCTLNENETFFAKARSINQMFEPFILEFCLLSVALLYTLFPFLKDTQSIGKSSSSSSSSAGYGYKYKAVNIIKDATKDYRSVPSLILGSFFVLLLIASSLNLRYSTYSVHNMRFSFIAQIIVFICILVFSRLALGQMKEYHRLERHDQAYKIEDMLLILSGPLGYLPFCLLVLFSSFAYKTGSLDSSAVDDAVGLNSDNEVEIRVWSAFWALTSIISVFVQTHFLIVGRHFQRDIVEERARRSSGDLFEDSRYIRRVFSASKIGQMLIVLLLSNFGFWLMESFFENNMPFVIPLGYWGDNAWTIIKRLLYPFLIFYRFHSVAIIVYIWMKFRVKK